MFAKERFFRSHWEGISSCACSHSVSSCVRTRVSIIHSVMCICLWGAWGKMVKDIASCVSVFLVLAFAAATAELPPTSSRRHGAASDASRVGFHPGEGSPWQGCVGHLRCLQEPAPKERHCGPTHHKLQEVVEGQDV